eukprot:scaffold1284_cov108-Cylindrotheca_fusiformis.AAC.13
MLALSWHNHRLEVSCGVLRMPHCTEFLTNAFEQGSCLRSNIVNMHRYSFSADVLIDPGANTELKLPARKVMQLELLPVGRPVPTRGLTLY